MSPLTIKALRVAAAEIGVREVGRNRGPRVDEYIRASMLDPDRGSYPWCVCFLQWVFQQAASALNTTTPLPRTAGVLTLYRRSPPLVRIKTPARGAIFCIDHGAGLGHAGLVEDIHLGTPGNLVTIEGNTGPAGAREGDGVYRRTRRFEEINLGFLDFGLLDAESTPPPVVS